VFVDPLARLYDDPDHSVDEHRFILVGHSLRGRSHERKDYEADA
jgi:hypothetical protein